MELAIIDKVGLMKEAYRIENISPSQCRSIFLDWALKLPMEIDTRAAIKVIIAEYAHDPAHPMSVVLNEGLLEPTRTRRRGGRGARTPLH